MKKNLEELQQEMRERIANATPPSMDDSSNPLANLRPSTARQVMAGKPLCSYCKRRVCRTGSTLCSRCTGKQIQQELRSTLPGFEPLPVRRIVNPDVPKPMEGQASDVVDEVHTYSSYEERVAKEGPYATTLPGVPVVDNTVICFTRKQVARMLGVSPTSIVRWEQKGLTPTPLKLAHNGKLLYTQEIVDKIREFISQTVVVTHPTQPVTMDGQQSQAARAAQKKVFKINRGLERAVSSRLGRLSGIGKLIP